MKSTALSIAPISGITQGVMGAKPFMSAIKLWIFRAVNMNPTL